MSYKIVIERKAQKEAERIPTKFRSTIDKVILALAAEPRLHGSKKLTDKEGYRIRISNYRVLYTIDDEARVVVIYRIKTKGKSTYR